MRPRSGIIRLAESVKNIGKKFRRNSLTVVIDANLHVRVKPFQVDLYRTTLRSEFYGVGQQVLQDLLNFTAFHKRFRKIC